MLSKDEAASVFNLSYYKGNLTCIFWFDMYILKECQDKRSSSILPKVSLQNTPTYPVAKET